MQGSSNLRPQDELILTVIPLWWGQDMCQGIREAAPVPQVGNPLPSHLYGHTLPAWMAGTLRNYLGQEFLYYTHHRAILQTRKTEVQGHTVAAKRRLGKGNAKYKGRPCRW